MPTPENQHPHHAPEHETEPGAGHSAGFEETDVSVYGIAVFLASLAAFVAVFFVFCFGLGKVINTAIVKRDGPPNQWHATGNLPIGKPRNMASSASLGQEELKEMTERFPTPRVQADDGDQDTAEMHAREDLLLDFYTWSDREHGRVRIPISRAMELLAQHGLPVAPAVQAAALMAGDKTHEVQAPLTDGFARTGYEQQYQATIEQERERGEKPADQALLQPAK